MITLPIKWKKARTVSGVSKRTGAPIEGRTRHILLLENWGGRKFGEFLCGARITNERAHQMFNLSDWHTETGRITCKKCLAAIQKMKQNGAA